jgi:LCP family protein required for cell wall assembly
MGLGGEGHDGAHLTDTMIIASLNTHTNEVVLTSIPRDFGLTIPGVGYNKINAAYAYAYRDDPNLAGQAAIDAVEKITGLEIPYFGVIDFKGFVNAVDHVGGLDIVVDQTFTDATFPNDFPFDTRGYLAPVTFTKGPHHMDGRTALIFARSRHSGNANEGSDFARSERQKKILTAFKEEISSLNLTNLSTLNNLLNDFTENFRTNFEPFELKRLADLAQKTSNNNIYSFSLEPDGIVICSALVDPQTGKPAPAPVAPPVTTPTPTPPGVPAPTPPPGGPTPSPTPTPPAVPEVVRMYVVLPCAGKTLANIHELVKTAPLLAKFNKEAATVEIQTSLGKPIDPARFKKLAEVGIVVKYVKFSGKTAYDHTTFYDNSKGSKPNTLDYLKSNYTFTTSDVNFPSSTADFVLILGKDTP